MFKAALFAIAKNGEKKFANHFKTMKREIYWGFEKKEGRKN